MDIRNWRRDTNVYLWHTTQRIARHRINSSLILYLYYGTFTSPIHQNIKQCISLCIPEFTCLIFFVFNINCVSYLGKSYFIFFETNASQILKNVTFLEVYNQLKFVRTDDLRFSHRADNTSRSSSAANLLYSTGISRQAFQVSSSSHYL